MAQHWRLDNASPNISYYNSPASSKYAQTSYGTSYRDRLTKSSEFSDPDAKATLERPLAYDYSESPNSNFDYNPSSTFTAFPKGYTSQAYNDDEEKYYSLRPTTAGSTSKNFYSPTRKHPSQKMSESQIISPAKTLTSKDVKHKKTLVLDLDETLIHASKVPIGKPDYVVKLSDSSRFYILRRPGLEEFLQRMSQLYELVIYTSSEKEYATSIIDKIDPHHRIRTILHRDHCLLSPYGLDKDLLLIGKDLKGVIFIDNLEENFRLQRDNGLKISDFYSNRKDEELKKLIPFLESMVDVPDVRPIKHWHSEFLSKELSRRSQSPKRRPESAYEVKKNLKSPNRLPSKTTTEMRTSPSRKEIQEKVSTVKSNSPTKNLKAKNLDNTFRTTTTDFRNGSPYSKKIDQDKTISYDIKNDRADLSEIDFYSNRKKFDESKIPGTWTATPNPLNSKGESSEILRFKPAYENGTSVNSNTKSNFYDREPRTQEVEKYSTVDNSRSTGTKKLGSSQIIGSNTRQTQTTSNSSPRRTTETRLNQTFYSPNKSWVNSRNQEVSQSTRYSSTRTDKTNITVDTGNLKVSHYTNSPKDSPVKKIKEKSPLLEDLYERIAALERKFKAQNLKTLNF